MRREPAFVVSTITAFLTALFAVAIAFGVDLSPEKREAILAAVAPCVAIIFLLGPLIRRFVYAPATVETIEAVPEPIPQPELLPQDAG